MKQIARGLALVRGCLAVVSEVPLLLVPGLVHALSTTAVVLLVLTSFRDDGAAGAGILLLFACLLVTTTVGVLCAAVVVAVTADRMDGGSAGLRHGVDRVRRHLPTLLLWGLTSATVGTVLRTVEERLGPVGRWMTSGVGVLFSLGTLLVVPVLVLEGGRPGAALRRSASLFRRQWGPTAVGETGLALVLGIAFGLFAIVVAVPLSAFGTSAAVAGVVGVLALLIATSATCSAVLSTALHRVATGGDGGAFGDLTDAFRQRRSTYQPSYAAPHGQWDAS